MNHFSSSYTNCKVLVTGGAGFIGSHLVEALIAAGALVTVLDDFSTGTLANLASVADRITLIGGSITDRQTCNRALQNQHIVFHCAAQTSVPQSMEDPLYSYTVNVQGTYTLLQAALSHKVKRFVFSSSSAVYGEREGRCTENLPCNPTSIYGVSKKIGEELCKNYTTFFNLETVCLRYFNVYGERQDALGAYAAAIARFNYNMRHNKPIILYGDGLQSRDFVSVHTVVEANMAVGMLSAEKVSGEIVNVASGKSVTLLEVVHKLQHEFPQYNQEIIFQPVRPGDIKRIEADCSKLQALLSY